MTEETTPTRYHPVHVVLHWLIAIMVIGAFAIGMTVLDSTPNSAPEKVTFLQSHATWGQILALPEKPFSLLSLLSEQPIADLDYVVLDITGRHHGVRDLSYIFDQLQGKGKSKFPSTFNYNGTLQ